MFGLTTDTFERPTDLSNKDDPDVRFARSYLRIRVAIGIVGILLPLTLWALEGFLLKGTWQLRPSLSAYYYSGARDVFVGGLCIIGFLMLTYSTGRVRSADFILSILAGIAALGVALLPTDRPPAVALALPCGAPAEPLPSGCTVVHQRLGEGLVGDIHAGSAIAFIVFLAALCWAFADSERKHLGKPGNVHGTRHVYFHRACCGLIVLAGVWALCGVTIRSVSALYAGEVVAVLSFGASWLYKGWDLVKQWRRELTFPKLEHDL